MHQMQEKAKPDIYQPKIIRHSISIIHYNTLDGLLSEYYSRNKDAQSILFFCTTLPIYSVVNTVFSIYKISSWKPEIKI